LGLASFPGKHGTHEAVRRFIDEQGLPRQGPGGHSAQDFEAPLAGGTTVAIKALDARARQPRGAVSGQGRAQRRARCRPIGDQGGGGRGLDASACVVDGEEGGPDRLRLLLLRGADGWLDPKDHLTEDVIDRSKQEGPRIWLGGCPGTPGLEVLRAQHAFQGPTDHPRHRTFCHKAGEHVAKPRGLLQRVWSDGPDRNKKRVAKSPAQGCIRLPIHNTASLRSDCRW
jgi:hypothetical protein